MIGKGEGRGGLCEQAEDPGWTPVDRTRVQAAASGLTVSLQTSLLWVAMSNGSPPFR